METASKFKHVVGMNFRGSGKGGKKHPPYEYKSKGYPY
jgi:hypothetical protein